MSADDGQRDGHVLPQALDELVTETALRLQPGVLVDQADRLQGHLARRGWWSRDRDSHLDRDEQGEAATVVRVGRTTTVFEGEHPMKLRTFVKLKSKI